MFRKWKSTFLTLLALIMIVTSVQLNTIQVLAFTDPSNMSDQTLFGVWEASTSTWTTEGKINYSFSTDLSPVENYVKQGDYANAKTELLIYYRNRTSRTVSGFNSDSRDTNHANLILDDVFTSAGETYLNTLTVNNAAQTISIDVLGGVQEAMDENKQITFILMGRHKTGSAATFKSREQTADNPVLEVTVGGGTQTLNAVKDTYIRPGTYGDTNYGTNTQLVVKDSGASFDDNTRRSYIQFDLSSFNTVPSSAVLKLNGKNASGTGSMDISVYKILDTVWDENTITWNTTYGNTFSWQGVSGSTDWLHPGMGAADQWKNIMNRFYFGAQLTYEYQVTSDESYANKLIDLMLDFINDIGNSTPGYESRIDAGIRSVFWIKSYDTIVNSTSMDKEANTGILKYIWQMGEYLQNPDNYDTSSNFGVLQTRGLYFISVYFPEFKQAPTWKTLADSRFDQLMKVLNKIDGSYTEDNTNYNSVTAGTFLAAKELGQMNNQTFGETFDIGLERMGRFIMESLFPNGYAPQYGDGDYTYRREQVLNIGNLYDNNELMYFGSSGVNGTEPDYSSKFFPKSNISVMRTGWDEQDLYLHINNNHGVHAHSDLLSTIVYAYEKPLIIDPGRYTYSTSSPIVQWLRNSPEAHNTIQINDSNGTSGKATKKMNSWESNGNYDFFEANHDAFSGFNHQRSVTFIKPSYWIVSDYVTSDSGTNKYQQTWHFLPDADASLDGTSKRIKTNFPNSANIQVIPADPAELNATLDDGYYSLKYQNVSNAKYASYVKNVSGNVSFDTVLFPSQAMDTNRNVTVERLSNGVAKTTATALKINLNDGNNGNIGYYYLSHEQRPDEARSFDIYNYNGKMAYIETNDVGNLENASIKSGTTLKKNSTNLIDSPLEISSMGLKWNGSTLEINGTDLKNDTNTNTAVAIYAPSVTGVTLNGSSVSFTRSGDYIYAVRPSKVVFTAETDFSSTQGKYNWSYQSFDGTAYTDLEYEASANRWEEPGGVHPYVGSYIQTTGSSKDSVRKWTAPVKGVIHIKGNVAGHPNYTTGDGRNVKILKNAGNVWPRSGWTFLSGNDNVGYDIVEVVAVNAGDTVEFIVNRFDTASSDHVIWKPVITLYPDAYLFKDKFEDKDSLGWTPLTPSRWTIGLDDGDYTYYINTSSYSNQSGKRPGEYSLIDNSNYSHFKINIKARMGDDVSVNAGADFAVLFNYQDSNNYYYMLMNNDIKSTQLFKVKLGTRELIADSDGFTDWVTDNNYHAFSVERDADLGSIEVFYDNNVIIRANDKEFNGGQVGIGSYNDSAYFDDIAVFEVK